MDFETFCLSDIKVQSAQDKYDTIMNKIEKIKREEREIFIKKVIKYEIHIATTLSFNIFTHHIRLVEFQLSVFDLLRLVHEVFYEIDPDLATLEKHYYAKTQGTGNGVVVFIVPPQ